MYASARIDRIIWLFRSLLSGNPVAEFRIRDIG